MTNPEPKELPRKQWGGRRKGAGRPRKDGTRNKGVTHVSRLAWQEGVPLHVKWKVRPEVWNLRSQRCFRVLSDAFMAGGERPGFRLVHYAVRSHQLHFLVEADDKDALAAAMNGLGVRIARALNRLMRDRRGRVFADRYDARVLATPAAVAQASAYFAIGAKPSGAAIPDEFASQSPFVAPQTQLLKKLR